MKLWPVLKFTLKGTWLLLSWSATLAAWTVYLLRWLHGARLDARRAAEAFDGALAVCARGHRTPLAGVWRCQACGWTAEVDTPWRCTNRECGVVTPHIPCAVCGLSIRNPYRHGGAL